VKRVRSSTINPALAGVLSLAAVARAAEDTWTYKADIPTRGAGWADASWTEDLRGRRGPEQRIGHRRQRKCTIHRPMRGPSWRIFHPHVLSWTCAFNGKIYVFGGAPDAWSASDKSVLSMTRKQRMDQKVRYALRHRRRRHRRRRRYHSLIGGGPIISAPPVSTVMPTTPLPNRGLRKPICRQHVLSLRLCRRWKYLCDGRIQPELGDVCLQGRRGL